MTTPAKGSAGGKRRGAVLAAALSAVPLVAGAHAVMSAPEAAAELPDKLKVVTLALYPGRNDDDHGGVMCTGTRTCEPVRYPYLKPKAGAEDMQGVVQSGLTGGPAVVFGYSQGARVAAQWLEQHAGTESAPTPDELSFVLIGNPGRRHGGAHVPRGHVTPDTEYSVIDVSRQYDRASDWPDRFRLLAFMNARAGLVNIHSHYDDVDIYDPANYVWTEGNTTYVFVPTQNIPLLEPLRKLGLDGLADRLNDPLKERIERAYDRSYLPDQPGWPVEAEPGQPAAAEPEPAEPEPAFRSTRDAASGQEPARERSVPGAGKSGSAGDTGGRHRARLRGPADEAGRDRESGRSPGITRRADTDRRSASSSGGSASSATADSPAAEH